MIRKLMLPALAIALLGGCATSAYQYRGGQGDYYYGQPSTQYRYYGSPYGYYGSPYGYYGSPYGYYGSPYGYSGYGYGYYGNGYGYPYRPPHGHYRGDGHNHGHGGRDHGDHDHDGDRDHDGDHNGGNHHGGRNPNTGDPPDGRLGIGGQPPVRPDRGPDFRPRQDWRDSGNLRSSPPDRRPLPFAIPRPQPAAPAVRSSGGGSVGSRVSGDTTESTSTDRKQRRIHIP